ncbi:MAG: ATP-binding cassette subfamily B protein [Halieaceae bacterium]|jgi:ATP-binding cassette subfamily B protein
MSETAADYDEACDDQMEAQDLELQLWRRLFAYALQYPRQLIYLAGFAFVTACIEVSYPLITRGVIDAVADEGITASLGIYMWAYALCTLGMGICVGGFIWMAGKIRTHISHDIRRDGFDNLQKLSFSFYDKRSVGWLMARMTSDCDRLANILAWGFMDLVWGVTMMTGVAIAMLVMNMKLGLIVLSILPFLWMVSSRFQVRILGSARAVRLNNSRITSAYNEAITGVLTSKAFVREEHNLADFSGLTNSMYDASVRNHVQAAVYVPIVLTMASLATGTSLALGGFDLLHGAISVGTLMAFLAYSRHFFEPIEQLGEWFAEMQMAQASAERILNLIDTVPEVRDGDNVTDTDNSSAVLSSVELRQVSFEYGNGKSVLQDISFSINQGETIALVGPTGGGKSTLVNVVCRFYEPTSGSILIDGVDYRSLGLNWLQSRLGIVLQSAYLFSGSVLENIRYGRLEASDEDVIAAARLAGVDAFIGSMEHGYHTEVGEGGGQLSAGQRQLVSIARAILADPQILVMDEATSSVDTLTEQYVQQGINNLLTGRISIVIAHRLSTIRNADRILLIEDGRIAEAGTHRQLLAEKGGYYRLYRGQSLDTHGTVESWPNAAP